jgi:hypothetical protein
MMETRATTSLPSIAEWRKRTLYCELVGSLNYLAVATRPDISYAVGRLASFHDCYREEHWALFLGLRYVKGNRSLSLTLGYDTSHSISVYCYSLSTGIVS